jgi:hypothetical protein
MAGSRCGHGSSATSSRNARQRRPRRAGEGTQLASAGRVEATDRGDTRDETVLRDFEGVGKRRTPVLMLDRAWLSARPGRATAAEPRAPGPGRRRHQAARHGRSALVAAHKLGERACCCAHADLR